LIIAADHLALLQGFLTANSFLLQITFH
jgi:hypothetical protein